MFKLFILLAAFWAIYVNAHAVANHYQRELKEGELVIHDFAIVQVVERSNEYTYLIKTLNHVNSVMTVERDELSIMDGCLDEICIKDVVFDTGYLRYGTIEGITYHGEYIIESSGGWNGYYRPFKNNIAKTSGCHPTESRIMCIGDKVKDFAGNIMTIIGFQNNLKLVLKSNDGWNTYSSNIDSASVTPLVKDE